jgi:uncharacterized protein YbbK (DUF523 family)
MTILISACLAGELCRFDGNHKLKIELAQWVRQGKAIPLCPEELGGLPTPRQPAEQNHQGKILALDGSDVTTPYNLGADRTLALINLLRPTHLYLKAKSPMCGVSKTYDGSHTRKLIDRPGLLRQKLAAHFPELDCQVIEV